MPEAVCQTIVNISIAVLFTGAFVMVGLRRRTSGRSHWFGISYAVGALTPMSELMVWASPYTTFFMICSYTSFSLAFHLMAKGLSVYYGQHVRNSLLVLSFAISLAARLAIWGGTRNTMPYELVYQTPFAVVMALCAVIVASVSSKRGLEYLLASLFWLLAAQFVVKAFAAVALNSGHNAISYMTSRYALFSQSVTAVLLVSTALTLLLILMRDTLNEVQVIADTDPLSKLPNRRGFEDRVCFALAERQKAGLASALILFDLDFFKSINDRFGHAAGDMVIRKFSDVLRVTTAGRATVGRLGGEEFAAFLSCDDPDDVIALGEAIRRTFAKSSLAELGTDVQVTVSAGISLSSGIDDLATLTARADVALYRAKVFGRNRVEMCSVLRP